MADVGSLMSRKLNYYTLKESLDLFQVNFSANIVMNTYVMFWFLSVTILILWIIRTTARTYLSIGTITLHAWSFWIIDRNDSQIRLKIFSINEAFKN